ncbi:MAG: glycoside hydrolase N-terminal domain-containing protein [Spirochaetales bacterium]|nr:glycoside hydrolase N-terminal domain-containing protein [Spirochaetales bacterium]
MNHSELWYGTERQPLPDVSSALKKTRKLMDEKRYKEADSIICDALSENGYNSILGSFLPFADIFLSRQTTSGFSDYRRSLNMETGEIKVEWKENSVSHCRKLFTSRADDLLVMEISAESGSVTYDVDIEPHKPDSSSSQTVLNDDVLNKNRVSYDELYKSSETKSEGNLIFYAAENSDGQDFGGVLNIIQTDGTISNTPKGITVVDAEKILILGKLFVKGRRETKWEEIKKALSWEDYRYDDLFHRHERVHRSLFNSASFQLEKSDAGMSNEELLLYAYQGETHPAMIQKMWAFGRYLFISSTGKDRPPCALYGLWCGDYNPIFCHNVSNINIQMIYSHALTGGLNEPFQSLLSYYNGLIKDSRENAAKLFGCRGIAVHGYTSPGIGLATVNVPVIMNWTAGAAWISQFFYEYYLFSGDISYLKKTAIPFMAEAALFYEDFLVEDQNGRLMFYPSVSPENSPGNYIPDDYEDLAHPLPSTINATMDIAVCKELLNNLIKCCRETDMYKDSIEKWSSMLMKLPEYELNEDSSVKEWIHPDFDDNDNHRHMAHIYPIFPGKEFRKEDNRELFEAFSRSAYKRMDIGLAAQSGWSLAYLAGVYARLKEGDKALECLDLLSRSCVMNNFMTTHNDWRHMGICLPFDAAPYQIDANMGWVTGVQEMLLFTSSERLELLPALPSKWKKGCIEDFRIPSGKISFKWNTEEGVFDSEITAEQTLETVLLLPEKFRNFTLSSENKNNVLEQTGERSYKIKMFQKSRLNISV